MGAKTEQLQIRVTRGQKAALKRSARRAGQDVSAYVLSRVLPDERLRFEELTRALAQRRDRRFALAALNDLLTDLPPGRLAVVAVDTGLGDLSPYMRNYLAAMVEIAAHRGGVAPPAWVRRIEPLEEPRFATSLAGLRAHLLRASPVPMRRRNIFVDSGVGDRV